MLIGRMLELAEKELNADSADYADLADWQG